MAYTEIPEKPEKAAKPSHRHSEYSLSVFNISCHSPPNPRNRSSILRVGQVRSLPPRGDPMPTPSQIEANRHQNSTGPTSVTGKAASSMNSLKSGTQAKIPPSPRKRTGDRPVCVTKSPPMSATHSRKMAYPHTRNTHGFRVLRHNTPAPAATRPGAHSRNPLLGQLGKAAHHPEGTPFPGATGGAGPVPASPEGTQPLIPPIGFVPPIASASPPHTSPPHTRAERPHVSHEELLQRPKPSNRGAARRWHTSHSARHTAHEDRSNCRQPNFRTLPESAGIPPHAIIE